MYILPVGCEVDELIFCLRHSLYLRFVLATERAHAYNNGTRRRRTMMTKKKKKN